MIRHGFFFNFAPELYQICTFLAATKKLNIDLSLHFPMFQLNVANSKWRGKMVMEKSWKNVLSSL